MAEASQSAGARQSLHANALAFEEAGLRSAARWAPAKAASPSASIRRMLAEETGRFCRLVGDDRIIVERHGDRLIARGHPAIRGMIERRGEGIIAVPSEPAAVLRLLIDLVPLEESTPLPGGRGQPSGNLRCKTAALGSAGRAKQL